MQTIWRVSASKVKGRIMRGGYKRQKEVSTLKNHQHRVSISVRPFALFVIRHRQPQRDPPTPYLKKKKDLQDASDV